MRLAIRSTTTRVALCAILFLVVLVLLFRWWITPPLDTSVIEDFRRSSHQYECLVRMLGENPKVGTVAPEFAFTADKPFLDAGPVQLGITQARLDEYRTTMQHAGVKRVDRTRDAQGILFFVWAWGAIDTFHHKGIAWYPAAPQSDAWRRFRHITGSWYVFDD
jgi:hypothetical protein